MIWKDWDSSTKELLILLGLIIIFGAVPVGSGVYQFMHVKTLTRIETLEKTCRSVN